MAPSQFGERPSWPIYRFFSRASRLPSTAMAAVPSACFPLIWFPVFSRSPSGCTSSAALLSAWWHWA